VSAFDDGLGVVDILSWKITWEIGTANVCSSYGLQQAFSSTVMPSSLATIVDTLLPDALCFPEYITKES